MGKSQQYSGNHEENSPGNLEKKMLVQISLRILDRVPLEFIKTIHLIGKAVLKTPKRKSHGNSETCLGISWKMLLRIVENNSSDNPGDNSSGNLGEKPSENPKEVWSENLEKKPPEKCSSMSISLRIPLLILKQKISRNPG